MTANLPTSEATEYKVLFPLNPGTASKALLALRCQGASVKPVVLLPIPQEVLDDSECFSHLEKETSRATILEHPGILKVYGLQKSDVGLCRAVEYAQGATLRTLLKQLGKIPAPQATRLISEVASGVYYAHMAGNEDGSPLVHGDLRPETIMISSDGSAKVTGYGALSVAPRESSGEGGVVGRKKYAAPEQVLGGRSAMAPTTDVFLLGVTLYEMITGEIPFQADDNPESAVIARPIDVDRPAIPSALRPVIVTATSKMSRDRYPSALDFKFALDEAMAGQGVTDQEVCQWFAAILSKDARQMELNERIAKAMEELSGPKKATEEQAQPTGATVQQIPSPNSALQTPTPPAPKPQQAPLTPPRPIPAAVANLNAIHTPLTQPVVQPPAPSAPNSLAPTSVVPQQVTIQGTGTAAPLAPEIQSAIAQAALSQIPTQPPLPVQIQLQLPAEAMPHLQPQEKKSRTGWVVACVLLVVVALMGLHMLNKEGVLQFDLTSNTPSNQTVAPENASPMASENKGAAEETTSDSDVEDASNATEASGDDQVDEQAEDVGERRDFQEMKKSSKRAWKKAGHKKAAGKKALRSASSRSQVAKANSVAVEDEEEDDDDEEEAPPMERDVGATKASSTSATDAKPSMADDDDELEQELEAALKSASAMERQHVDPPMKRRVAESDEASDPDSQKPGLHLFTIPQVNVRIQGGKVLGRTPLKVELAPGSYILNLYDQDNRIHTSRMVKVKDGGPTKLDFTLGIGGIFVTAPDGADVIIDGKRWGVAPISKAIELYEGQHTLKVQTEDDSWEKSFELHPNDMLNFNLGSGHRRK